MFENIKSKRSPIGIEFIKRGLLTENQVDRVVRTPLIKKTAQKRKIFMKYH